MAPNSKKPVTVNESSIEFCIREVGSDIFLLACRRGGSTTHVTFSGLPDAITDEEVRFEAPRKVKIKAGQFLDWLAPYEVHVYRLRPMTSMLRQTNQRNSRYGDNGTSDGCDRHFFAEKNQSQREHK